MTKILKGVDSIYMTETSLFITGTPLDDNEDSLGHNCDEMGCSSFEHVLAMVPLSCVIKGYNPAIQEEDV